MKFQNLQIFSKCFTDAALYVYMGAENSRRYLPSGLMDDT